MIPQVSPNNYENAAKRDYESAVDTYVDNIQNAHRHNLSSSYIRPPNIQDHIDDMKTGAETENMCIRLTHGPLYFVERERKSCFNYDYCKASITIFKFIFSMAAIIQIALETSYYNQTTTSSGSGSYTYGYVTTTKSTTKSLTSLNVTSYTMPPCYPTGLAILALNLLRLTYIIFMSFCAIKGLSVGFQLFSALICRGCLELSFYDDCCCFCCCSSKYGVWKLLQDNIIVYMLYYGLCSILYFSFGICISQKVYMANNSGVVFLFIVMILTILNFCLEVGRYITYKKVFNPFH